eukprot:gene4786-5246_t
MSTDYTEFPLLSENVNGVAMEVMFQVLESKKYVQAKTTEWSDAIGNKIIEKLRLIAPHFKLIVSCCIIQKVGAGLHSEVCSYWDPRTDGVVVAKYENDSVICICTVVGVSI